jgi:hypothetical protein
MVFTTEQVRSIKQGKTTGALVPISDRVAANRLRWLRRRNTPDENGQPPARPSEIVQETLPDGERIAVVLTILAVRNVEVALVTFADARACGFKTPSELREHWHDQHPRTLLARLVRFAVGDLRDSPRLLAPTGSGQDYTCDVNRAMGGTADPGEGLTREQLRALSMDAQQRWLADQARTAKRLADQSVSGRLAAIQCGTVATTDE